MNGHSSPCSSSSSSSFFSTSCSENPAFRTSLYTPYYFKFKSRSPRTLAFYCTKSLPKTHHFRTFYKFPKSDFPVTDSQLSDAEDDYEDDDDDEDEAAEEYDVAGAISPEIGGVIEDEAEDEDQDDDSSESDDRPSQFEEFKWQRVERFCKDVREFGDGIIDVDELVSVYNFRIDKFQRLAIEAFLRGSSVVVSAPTSAGKTLIAEAAAVATVARQRRLFYTTPLKALSNQKFREFRDAFGESNVGLVTGDSVINKDAQVLIMTTEVLRNMLYQSVGIMSSESGLFHVDVIVLDEVHYLSDISRGTVWEEIVIYCPKEVQLICLSATVANPDELCGWINQIHGKTELVTSSKRPVPLTWHFSTKAALQPLLNVTGTNINKKVTLNYMQLNFSEYADERQRRRSSRKHEIDISPLSKNDINSIRRSQVPQVIDTLWHLKTRDMLPAVWFIFSRKGCDAAVQYVEDCKLLDECEISEVELALKRFRINYPDAVRESSVKGILRGIAAHHAGCLPLWKSFIEELFQRGLLKVVFATETLAAGINMPARTAVISSLSKRSGNGRIELTTNELLQMAGRAGRRGIDKSGHAVFIQSPYEGAEECCKLLFGGLQPLVSQFTVSYGMVLNLLAGSKVTHGLNERDGTEVRRAGRTLEEARKLVEQSFGNYVGSAVMLAAQEELIRIENEIEILTREISDEAIDRNSKRILSTAAYEEMAALQEELRAEKRIRTELRRKMERERISSLRPLLQKLEDVHLPFICLRYHDTAGTKHLVPAVYLGSIDSMDGSKLKDMVVENDSFTIKVAEESDVGDPDMKPSYHVALGSDNMWYLFTERCIKVVYNTGFPNTALSAGGALPRETMSSILENENMQWKKLSMSEHGGLWCMEGSIETWSWSLNVPVLSSLAEDGEVTDYTPAYFDLVESYKNQRNRVSRLKKNIAKTEGFKEYKKIVDMAKFTEEKIRRLKTRSERLTARIKQIEPFGWKDFLQVSSVIHEARALDINTNMLFPLGETAAAIRGENELWIAMVLRNKVLLDLKPAQLAAVFGSIVSEGIKVRPSKDNSFVYEPSTIVQDVVNFLEDQKSSLLELQEKHGVKIPCYLDSQFSGMVEAWASGLTWREIMMDCAMDDGDLARLLRRTIDILTQIPKLPDIDPRVQKNAIAAANVMDRPPISELGG